MRRRTHWDDDNASLCNNDSSDFGGAMTTNMKYPEKRGVKCIVCKKSFTDEQWENRHTLHADDCPNNPKNNAPLVECDCDFNAHASHCPECEPDRAYLMDAERKAETP